MIRILFLALMVLAGWCRAASLTTATKVIQPEKASKMAVVYCTATAKATLNISVAGDGDAFFMFSPVSPTQTANDLPALWVKINSKTPRAFTANDYSGMPWLIYFGPSGVTVTVKNDY